MPTSRPTQFYSSDEIGKMSGRSGQKLLRKRLQSIVRQREKRYSHPLLPQGCQRGVKYQNRQFFTRLDEGRWTIGSQIGTGRLATSLVRSHGHLSKFTANGDSTTRSAIGRILGDSGDDSERKRVRRVRLAIAARESLIGPALLGWLQNGQNNPSTRGRNWRGRRSPGLNCLHQTLNIRQKARPR